MGYLLRYQSEFTELAKSRFLDCDSCGMTQGALIRYVADRQALYMQAKQTRSDILYMTTLDTGRCSHNVWTCVDDVLKPRNHDDICVQIALNETKFDIPANYIPSQVGQNTRTLYQKVAQNSLKVANVFFCFRPFFQPMCLGHRLCK